MTRLSSNIASLRPSATQSVSAKVKQLIASGHDILDLCVGEPDFPTPPFIAEAGMQAIKAGKTRYTPAPGIAELRAAIAADMERLAARPRKIDPQGIVVTAGAKQALFNLCFCLFGEGDRVLVPVPYWTTYPELVSLSRAEPVTVKGDASRDFKVTPDDLEKVAGAGVKGLMLNSPSNPSGAVYSLEELEAIARWAAEREVWIISDEIYRRIYFDGPLAPGILDLPEELTERAIVVDGASKSFAMTGWRMGFSYSPRDLAEKMAALQSQTTSSTATPTQYAALAAYRAGPEELDVVERMRQQFQARRDLLVRLFGEKLPEVRFVVPEGAFYLWIATDGLAREGEGSVALCERLLTERGVALVPGEAFGDDGYVRMSFAYSEDTLREAVERLARR
jgi:aspartate aminotransferase